MTKVQLPQDHLNAFTQVTGRPVESILDVVRMSETVVTVLYTTEQIVDGGPVMSDLNMYLPESID